MRRIVLFMIFVLTVAMLTGAWWMAYEESDDATEGFPQPLAIGIVIALIVQALGWNLVCRFPLGWKVSYGVGFPIATTLMALGLGDFLVFFLPHTWDYIFSIAMSLVVFGAPAFFGGAIWFASCCMSWEADLRASRDSQSSVDAVECDTRLE